MQLCVAAQPDQCMPHDSPKGRLLLLAQRIPALCFGSRSRPPRVKHGANRQVIQLLRY